VIPAVIGTARTEALYRLFSDLIRVGNYCTLTLFETLTPGATDALRAYADSYGYPVKSRTVMPPDAPPIHVLTASLHRPGVNGPVVTVQWSEQVAS
jgi:hypothetical protein